MSNTNGGKGPRTVALVGPYGSGKTTLLESLLFTAGAGPMYCGSCIRDNALAAEIKLQGHDITLLPVYTPTLTDEPNVSVNPLSALAPGVLRRIFEGKMPNASQAPSNNAPKPATPLPAAPATTPTPPKSQ